MTDQEHSNEELPFAGLKVIDIASYIAAPVAATILGDLGADVIKVELPGDGDGYRQFGINPPFDHLGVNFPWLMDNRGKRGLTLNLKNESAQKVLRKLVEGCDVYITNQPPPVRRSLKITYEDLAPLNPRMIFASLTGYGETGAESDSSAFDQVAYWARSGLADLMRPPGIAPTQGLPGMGDHPTGVSLYAAITTALYRRERSGKGGLVHTSLLANGFWSVGFLGQAALAGYDFSNGRAGILNPDAPPLAINMLYETQDGRYIQLNMVRKPGHMECLLETLGLETLLSDPLFATEEDRASNGPALAVHLREAFGKRSLAEWLSALNAKGVPASPVVQPEEIIGDQQAIENQVLMAADKNKVGMPYVINHPVQLDGVAGRGPLPAPEVGEHSVEILQELGFSEQEIEQMKQEGAF